MGSLQGVKARPPAAVARARALTPFRFGRAVLLWQWIYTAITHGWRGLAGVCGGRQAGVKCADKQNPRARTSWRIGERRGSTAKGRKAL